jgi:beta-lactamase regulating signal transducer with metallopeptidase domain
MKPAQHLEISPSVHFRYHFLMGLTDSLSQSPSIRLLHHTSPSLNMTPPNRSTPSFDPTTREQRSAETHPRLNIVPIIVVYTSLSILLGIMLYIAILKIIRRIQSKSHHEDVESKLEMGMDRKSVQSK